jgi:hypothetical protein
MKRSVWSLFSAMLLSFLNLFGQGEMLGPLTKEAILKAVPDWEGVAAAYNPKPHSLQKLKAIPQPIRVEVYLGTWCSDSKNHVSAYFKILDMTDNPLIQTVYIGIPRDKAARSKFLPQAKNIEKLPTFLVYKDGKELGRIIETPAKSVEEDLLAILNK